jgi:hypothetical protein
LPGGDLKKGPSKDLEAEDRSGEGEEEPKAGGDADYSDDLSSSAWPVESLLGEEGGEEEEPVVDDIVSVDPEPPPSPPRVAETLADSKAASLVVSSSMPPDEDFRGSLAGVLTVRNASGTAVGFVKFNRHEFYAKCPKCGAVKTKTSRGAVHGNKPWQGRPIAFLASWLLMMYEADHSNAWHKAKERVPTFEKRREQRTKLQHERGKSHPMFTLERPQNIDRGEGSEPEHYD